MCLGAEESLKGSTFNLRIRFSILMLLIIAPAVGMVLIFAIERYFHTTDLALLETRQTADQVRANQIQGIESIQQLLAGYQSQMTVENKKADCELIFGQFAGSHPALVNLALLNAQGGVICAQKIQSNTVDWIDLEEIDRMESELYIGSLRVDPGAGTLVLPVTLRLEAANGMERRFLYAGIDPAWLKNLVSNLSLPSQSCITMLDARGQVIYVTPNSNGVQTGDIDPFGAIQAIIGGPGQSAKAKGLDGIERFYTYLNLQSEQGQDFAQIRLGLPVESAYADFNRLMLAWAGLLAAMILISYLVAYMVSGEVLTRRSRQLKLAAEKIAQGDLGARTPLITRDRDGLIDLEITFNKMAEALQQRDEEHVRTELELRQLNEQILTIIQSSPLALVVVDEQNLIQVWNPAAETLFGWAENEVVGRPLPYIPLEDQTERAETWQKIKSGKLIYNQPVQRLRKDGSRVDISLSIAPLYGGQSSMTGAIIAMADITAQKEAQRAVEESQRTLATLLSNLSGMAYRSKYDSQWTMEFVSTGCFNLTGVVADDLVQNHHRAYAHFIVPEDRQRVWKEVQQAVDQRSPFQLSYRIRSVDGKEKWVWEQGAGIYSPDGDLLHLEGYITDITDLKQRESELEALTAISASMRSAQSRSEMYRSVLEQIYQHFSADGAMILVSQPQTQHARVELGLGVFRRTTGYQLEAQSGMMLRLLGEGKAFLTDARVENGWGGLSEVVKQQSELACAPLIDRDRIIGAIVVGSQQSLPEGALRMLTAVADIAASTMRRLALHEQTEKRLQHVTAVRTIETAITTSLDLHFTIHILLDQVVTQLNVDAADIWLKELDSTSLQFVSSWGFRGLHSAVQPFEDPPGFTSLVAEGKHLLAISDIQHTDGVDPAGMPYPSEGFVAYYGVPLVAKGQLHGVLELFHRRPLVPDEEWIDFLNTLASAVSIAIDNARLLEKLQKSNVELAEAYDETILGWSLALELRDAETQGHAMRLIDVSLRLAEKLGVPQEELIHIRRGVILHDIGKMAVPDSVLLKPGPLNEEEWELMRKHTLHAQHMLSSIDYLKPALVIPTYHHENWDGSGYPYGLRGTDIPLAARLFSIVDVWDALRKDRPYRKAWAEEKVRQYLMDCSGKKFDPQVVQTFLALLEEMDQNGEVI